MSINKQNIIFTSSSEIKNIAAPIIEYFNFFNFVYSEVFIDGSRLILASDTSITVRSYCEEIHIFSKYSNDDTLLTDLYSNNEIYCSFDSDKSQFYSINKINRYAQRHNEYMNYLGSSFGIVDRFIITKKNDDISRAFIFNMDKNSCAKFEIMLNLDLIKHFSVYFENAAFDIINSARNQEKIIKPWRSPNKYFELKQKFTNVADRKAFIKKTQIKKLYFDSHGHKDYLTNAELQCALQLAYGKTAKEIARVQGISKRTVEKYMENIRQKLSCSHRSQVIDFIFDKGLNGILH